MEVLDIATKKKWRFTAFYGWPDEPSKHKSWQLLRLLRETEGRAWICGGDFNQILSVSDKLGGDPPEFRGSEIV